MKILFQGDSITDWFRDKRDPHDLGRGYARYAAQFISARHPELHPEFLDLGISGNKVADLAARWQTDCIDLQPDVVSILIGVNDTWHHAEKRDWIPHEMFEADYRFLLEEIRHKTHARIILLEQFLTFTPDKAFFREDLDPKIQITRKLAREYADVFIPLDGLLAARSVKNAPTAWAEDGVHPTEAGATLIGEYYADAFDFLLSGMQA